MGMEEIQSKIIKVFNEIGITLLKGEEDVPIEIDSIQYVSLIVSIEDSFDIIIDDEDLMMPDIITLDWVCNLVTSQLNTE